MGGRISELSLITTWVAADFRCLRADSGERPHEIALGFFKVCTYGQSDIDEFKETTDKTPSGFDNPSNDNMSLYLEAKK